MKISRKRKAISQSMDLFIIIAAVLGVGGVVTGAVFGLAGSASSNSVIQIVQGSASGGGASAVNAFSITVKNAGSSTITGSMTVTLGGTKQSVGTAGGGATCPTPSFSSGTAVVPTCNIASGTPSPIQLTATALTLAPGQQVAISEGPLNLVGTTNGVGWTVGTSYTVTVLFGSAQSTIQLTA